MPEAYPIASIRIHITDERWLQNRLLKRCEIRNFKHKKYANRARRIANNVIIQVSW